MSEPQHDSIGYSIASGGLTERLAQRALGRIGVVDTDHPRALYLRTSGWIADRFPLLAHLNASYATGHEGYQQGQPMVMGRGLNTTEEAPREFAQNVPSSARVSRLGEDSVAENKSSDPSLASPVTYRVSRQPSHRSLKIERATRGGDSLASRARGEPHDSIKESGPQVGLAPDADMTALSVAPPVAAGDPRSEKPSGRPETGPAKAGPTNHDDSGISSGSLPDASLGNLFETPSRSHKSELVKAQHQSEVRHVSRSSEIGQGQDALVLLKRDKAFPAKLSNRESPPASVTEMSSTQAVDGASEAREPAANREPPTGVAPIALETRESVPPPTLGNQGASGNLVAPILTRQRTSSESPLILRQPATGKPEATEASLTGDRWTRDFAAISEDSGSSGAFNPGDGTPVMTSGGGEAVMRTGAEAGQPAIVPSRAADPVAVTIAPGPGPRPIEPLVLRKARIEAGEAAPSEQAAQAKKLTVNEQRTINPAALELRGGLTAPRLAAQGMSRQAAPSASSPAATRALVSTPSLPLVKPQTSPMVQRKPRESDRAAVPGFETDSGLLVAREIRTASHQTETPNIVWRQSAGPVLGSQAPDPTVMSKAGGSTLARSLESASSSGSLQNSQSETPQPPEMNQSPSVDVGRITEQIVRAIQRRLDIERERRGMGR